MKPETYTLVLASNRRGSVRKMTVPFYALHLLAVLAVVGGITLTAAVGSYSRMLWKVGNYNALRRNHDNLQQQVQQLQKTAKDADQRLTSLQSLATEVAMTYGFVRLRNSPFGVTDVAATDASGAPEESFEDTVAQFNFLEKNVTAATLPESGLHLTPSLGLGEITYSPSLWPVVGPITDGFGERMDPFSGEGAFHTGVDIAASYGNEVRTTADGVVVKADEDGGYGRLVVIDHGFGFTTYYGHLSTFTVSAGMRVTRGEVIGHVGVSGRTTGPHLHYEVRINDAPVNPMRYLRYTGLTAD